MSNRPTRRAAKRGSRRRRAELGRVVEILREWEILRELDERTPEEDARLAALHEWLSRWCRANEVLDPAAIAEELAHPRRADEIAEDLR